MAYERKEKEKREAKERKDSRESRSLQMPPPTMIAPMRNAQTDERMDIPGTSTGMQRPQRPPSMGNPDYISPLKREI
uniref:Uncharacterized protein n=1 Tax=Romanomermis culicivorax TaxID=13658 RepID=A0A915HYA2_ROMCU